MTLFLFLVNYILSICFKHVYVTLQNESPRVAHCYARNLENNVTLPLLENGNVTDSDYFPPQVFFEATDCQNLRKAIPNEGN